MVNRLIRCLKIDIVKIIPSKSVTLLGVIIDTKLSFHEYTNMLYKTATCKMLALRRIRRYLDIDATQTLYKSYIYSYFLCCSLIWMFSSKPNNVKID